MRLEPDIKKPAEFPAWRTFMRYSGFVCGVLWWSTVPAQQSVNTLPEVLKGIKAADGVCRRNEPAAGMQENTPAAESLPPDFSCAISITDASPRITVPNTLFADLRTAADYGVLHIPGTLSLSASDVRTRPYWREKDVILVGNGKAEHELYALCANLKKNGYKKVQVLRGGMPMWLSMAQPVSGRAPLEIFAAKLTAAELWHESQGAENLVVLSNHYSASQTELPFAVLVKEMDEKTIKTVIERRRKELKKAPLASLVLGVDETVTDQYINALQQAIQPIPILVYRGSSAQLNKEIAQQKAIWLARERGPKQLGCGL